MKRKPFHEMTLAELEAGLARVKRDPKCLPQDIEHWQSYIDLHNCGRNVVAANRLAEIRRASKADFSLDVLQCQPSKPRVRVKANSSTIPGDTP